MWCCSSEGLTVKRELMPRMCIEINVGKPGIWEIFDFDDVGWSDFEVYLSCSETLIEASYTFARPPPSSGVSGQVK
jgi:hypothetical protein